MIDPESLYKLYLDRRNRFLDDLNKTPNELIEDKLLHCIYTTDLCIKTFEQLGRNVKKIQHHFKADFQRFQQQNEDFVKYFKLTEAKLDEISSGDLKQVQAKLLLALTHSHMNTLTTCYEAITLNTDILMSSVQLSIYTLPTILESDDAHFVQDAIIGLMKMIMGITPAGPFVSGLEHILSIFQARTKQLVAASSYLDNLDSYLESAFHWCIATQVIIDITNSLGTEERELSLDSSVQAVSSRFQGILDTAISKSKS